MSDDISPQATDTSVQDSASAGNPGQDQTTGANAGAGTVDTATSSGADQATPSQSATDSNSAQTPMDRFTDKVKAHHGIQDNSATAPAQTSAQLTMEQINQALGLKGPEDLKRIVGERSLMGRQANELGQLRQQLATVQQQQQAERQRQEQDAQKAALSPFHAKHPQYQANNGRIANAKAFERAASGILNKQDPNYNAQYGQLAASMGVTREDLQLSRDATAYQERNVAEMTADPEGFVEARAMRVVQQQIAQFDQYLNNRLQAQSFVQQHQDLINDPQMQQVMATAMDERTSRAQLAVQIATLQKEKSELLARATTDTAEVETLKAQQELAGRQTLQRRRASTSTTTLVDPWAAYEQASKDDPKAQEKLLERLLKR